MSKLSDEDVDRIAERLAAKLAERQAVQVLPPMIHIDPRYVPPTRYQWGHLYNPLVTC